MQTVKKITEFILSELRKMDGEILIKKATQDFEMRVPEFTRDTCFTEFLETLRKLSKENEEMLAYISKKEGEYDAYKKIMEIIQKDFAL